MASHSLSDLPPELVIGIFSCVHDHHAITALNLASRKFYETWKLNTATIIKAVLPRAIECFDLAQELLAVQSKSPSFIGPQSLPKFLTEGHNLAHSNYDVEAGGGQAASREAVLERSKRLLINAAVVAKSYNSGIFVIDGGTYLTYITSLYRLWIAIELGNHREALDSRLQAATLEGLRDMAKMIDLTNLKGFYRVYFGIGAGSRYHRGEIGKAYSAIRATLKLRESLSGG